MAPFARASGLAALGLVLVLNACGSAPTPTSTGEALDGAALGADRYRLGPGDRLRVTIFGHEDLSGEFDLDGAGNATLPLVGEIQAGNKTEDEVEQIIVEKLSPAYLKDPSVSVDVINYRPFYIFGEVNQPGSYPYVNGMTVINAVALAGGFTYRARQSSVDLTRGSDPTAEPQSVKINASVFPGDVIEVRERYF